jgi:deoxyribonuclease-2
MAGVMSINHPQVYASKVLIQNSNITLLINNNTISEKHSYSYNFNTLGGLPMTYFAKSPLANVDLYESIVSPFYNDGMILETWGRPWESDFCPPNYKYESVNADEISIGKYWWTSYYDHSKWGIGMTTNLLCYSDINRMYSQWTRGGGSVCTVNAALFTVHKSFIEKYDSC